MSLKRTVYHFAGKDYEATDIVEFTFFVQRVPINNFLNLNYAPHRQVRKKVRHIGSFLIDHAHTNVDAAIKPIIVRCMAATLFLILEKLGMHNYSDIDNMRTYVRNRDLRAKQSVTHDRYNGIHVFDPITKSSWLASGAPKKIEGKQAVINGKLWRKYIVK